VGAEASRGAGPTLRTAGLFRRGVAATVDALWMGGVFALLAFSFRVFPFIDLPDPPWNAFDSAVDILNEHLSDIAAAAVLLLVIVLIGTFAAEATLGRTPGHALAGTRLVDTRGRSPSLLRLGLRALGRTLELPLLGMGWALGFVLPSRRTLHDLVSGTLVVTPRARRTP